ncbi:MAG: MBL fold metallo-hydrolase [Clostridia bacterium]
MKLTFLGATHEVTGSCSFLEVAGKQILIDYGMEQGKIFFENQPIPINVAELDAVLLTHAHIDHSGQLPILYKHGYRGAVHATRATANLCDIMLRDSAHIQEFEAEWRSRKAQRSGEEPYEPPYTMADAMGIISLLSPHDYGARFTLLPGVDVRFTDAGHLLGSSSIELWLTEDGVTKKLVFSGDLGNINQPLLNDASMIDEADYVVIESTYGDRVHEVPPDYANALADILQKTFDRGGSVIIPSFAVGRTQELLYFLRQIKAKNLVRGHDGFPVYVDSPLANAATRIFVENGDACYDEEAKAFLEKGINPITFPGLVTTETADESKAINNVSQPKVILSASGMCEAGRIKHHLKHNLWNPKNTVLFVGYQSEGTVGRSLLQGAKKIKLFGEDVRVGAEILQFPGISGHGDSKFLLSWINHFSPRPTAVFVNHGESSVVDLFTARLHDTCGLNAFAPYSGSQFDLTQNVWVYEAMPVPMTKRADTSTAVATSVYDRLLAALERLTKLIKQSTGRANREVKEVTRQLNNIADEWEHE